MPRTATATCSRRRRTTGSCCVTPRGPRSRRRVPGSPGRSLENERHTQYTAAQEDEASPHYRIGRFGGRGHGLHGAWDEDRTTDDGVVRPFQGRVSQRQLRQITAERSSGELSDMPDIDQVDWSSCPRGTAAS